MDQGIQETSQHFINYLGVYSSISTAKLDAALAKAQGEFNAVVKGSENPHFKSKYADLAAIVDAVRPALAKNGIALSQVVTGYNHGKVFLVTRIAHQGEWMASECQMPARGDTAQSVGSAITYAKRYALAAILCVAAEDDDDGNDASIPNNRAVQGSERVVNGAGKGSSDTSPKASPKPAPKPKPPTFPDVNGWSKETVNAYVLKAFGVDDYKAIPTVEEKKWLFEFIKATPYETYLKSIGDAE